jgi:hypothetical protein
MQGTQVSYISPNFCLLSNSRWLYAAALLFVGHNVDRLEQVERRDGKKPVQLMIDRIQDRWKLPTPSRIAIRNFSRITAFELYSGSLR